MRSREEIVADHKPSEALILEVLMDIRGLLGKEVTVSSSSVSAHRNYEKKVEALRKAREVKKQKRNKA